MERFHYLFERLSGLPIDASSAAANDSHHFRTRTADFVRNLTPQLTHVLDEHAREFLTVHGIDDEPPSWQPPTHLLNDLSLPGPDPTDIDLARLHHLIRIEEHTPGETADILGTTADTIRHLLELHPAPLTSESPKTSAYLTAKTALTPDTLANLYLHQHLSTADIATRVGVDATVIARLARDYHIPVRKPGRPLTTHVERDWLHEQYTTQGRTLTELANETGIARGTMATWAHRYNIPLRRQDSYINRRTTCTAAEIEAAPALLQPALAAIDGLSRLEQFAAASHHPTLASVAENLGIHADVLRRRIRELELDLGGELLNRAHAQRPMTLTPLGQATLDTLKQNRPSSTTPRPGHRA
ncbi:LysR family transcriptional regulator [Nocardia sp. CA2R105]|uniref:LysR family transcriptional regulator n=1 Tax=Nocardia coffeae TaxID=2873381 RepID=UPI001CA75067|nr:LysR family transcriptional regulator [Nocardia coffeae]MBY8859397.1 LysR family transcriptional regulator [Nocardia coffeae]